MKKTIALMKSPYMLSTILVLLLGLQIWQNRAILADVSQPTTHQAVNIVIGKAIQHTQLHDPAGQTVDLLKPGARYHLLIFFATTCEYCKQDLGLWNTIAAHNPDVAIYGVSTETDAAALAQYQAQHNIAFPLLMDQQGELARELDLKVTPTKILLSAELKPLYVWYGYTTKRSGNQDLGALYGFLNIDPALVPGVDPQH